MNQVSKLPFLDNATQQAASDYNVSEADLLTFSQTHRFTAGGGMLKSSVRQGHYDRDQRAGTIRFCTTVALGCPATPPGADTISDATRLIEITLGSDSNPNSVDELQRALLHSSQFDARALGVYVQDLVQVATNWKLLGGLRWDHFKGSYQSYSTAPTAANGNAAIGLQTSDYRRTDTLWSKRLGALWQPNEQVSAYAFYGTSFNTSGDTYQYDSQSSNTPPESSENYARF